MKHQISSRGPKQCMERFHENNNFDILLCKTALFQCKSSCTEVFKWLFCDFIHLLMYRSQYSSTKLNVIFFKIHGNSQKTKIRCEMVQFDPWKVSNFGFLRISAYFEKHHTEFGTRTLTFTHEKMYGIKKKSF